jgi:hypothetical protein
MKYTYEHKYIFMCIFMYEIHAIYIHKRTTIRQ